jgi:hypothetical protein
MRRSMACSNLHMSRTLKGFAETIAYAEGRKVQSVRRMFLGASCVLKMKRKSKSAYECAS